MTSSATRGSLPFPSSRPETIRSRWLALVYPASARTRSQPGRRGIRRAARGGFAPFSHAVLPPGGVRGGTAPLGNSPQTR